MWTTTTASTRKSYTTRFGNTTNTFYSILYSIIPQWPSNGVCYLLFPKQNSNIVFSSSPFAAKNSPLPASNPSPPPRLPLLFLFSFWDADHVRKPHSLWGDFWSAKRESGWKGVWKGWDVTHLLNDLVTRFAATSMTYNMDMLIDINTDVYPLKANDKFTLALASTLYKDNRPDPGVYTDYSKEVVADAVNQPIEHPDGWLRILHVWKGVQVPIQREWKDVSGCVVLFLVVWFTFRTVVCSWVWRERWNILTRSSMVIVCTAWSEQSNK